MLKKVDDDADFTHKTENELIAYFSYDTRGLHAQKVPMLGIYDIGVDVKTGMTSIDHNIAITKVIDNL